MAQQETYQIIKFESSMPFFFRMHQRNAENQIRSSMVLEHWHKGLEINYVCIGPTDYVIDGVHHQCHAGDVCLINSGSIHSIYKHFTELDDACDAFTTIIDYEFLKLVVPDIDNCYFALTDETMPIIRKKMDEILKCYESENYQYRHVALTGHVYQLIFLLCEFCQRERGIVEMKTRQHILHVCKIMEYVEKHYQELTNQSEVARQMGFSREHFCRYFKQYTGITFREYLTRYRLNKAKQLIETSTDTELTIALDVGFSDVKQMSSAFKKYYNMTPSQYRKTYQKCAK